ncbi:hypothetical protein EVAR_25147_1 [Eumeta japonica]|uniref:Uncharacterized protein n=1 Tax=Eumeta variegata TaxID=151549 RepID=A0A4C1VSY0_EUMVA|nr:hypothetical protein EVAR_25147_1 [Eumeta japonica]
MTPWLGEHAKPSVRDIIVAMAKTFISSPRLELGQHRGLNVRAPRSEMKGLRCERRFRIRTRFSDAPAVGESAVSYVSTTFGSAPVRSHRKRRVFTDRPVSFLLLLE